MNKKFTRILPGFLLVFGVFTSKVSFSQVDVASTGGTPTATYSTVSAAFTAVNAGTHTGVISVSITANTTEPSAPDALLTSGVGSASFTSLVIRPTVTAVISGSPDAGSGVINFIGSDNVTIDGSITAGGTTRNLTIQHTGATSSAQTAAIRLIGSTVAEAGLGVTDLTIRNTILIGNTTGNNGSGSTVISSYGIYAGSFLATLLPSGGTSANYDNITIENNEIRKAYIGIYIGNTTANKGDNLVIRNNTIGSETASDMIGTKGIVAYNVLGGNITSNTVFNIQVSVSGSISGIELIADNLRVSSNVIRTVYNTSTSGWGASGLLMSSGNNYVVDNNVISDIRTTNYSAVSSIFNASGIRIGGGTGHKLYYNTVHLFGNYTYTGNQSAASAALNVVNTTSTGLDIRNNIFSNTMTSVATGIVKFAAVWFPASYNFQTTTLDHNYYSIPNDERHLVGRIGSDFTTGTYLTLATWKAISQVNNAANDVHSFPIVNTVAPFTSNTNLKPLAGVQTYIESGAVAIADLATPNVDITGTTRPATGGIAPDMGAYEFAGIPVTCPQPQTVSIMSADLNSAKVTWTPGGSESSWQIQYGPTGFALGSGISVVVTQNPYTVPNLLTQAFYQVYVRSICGPGDTSLWTGPVGFNTYDQGQYIDWNSNCPANGFMDISTTGTPLNLADDGSQGVTLPFPVLYQGILCTDAVIGNNGAMVLGATTAYVGFFNSEVASATLNNTLFPFWDDMGGTGVGVFYKTTGTAPNRQFIVQWTVDHNGVDTNPLSYQLVIDEETYNIHYLYDNVVIDDPLYDYGASATIGASGAQDIQVSYNSTTYLKNNTCVEIYYTDCPSPKNFVTTALTTTSINFTWSAGASSETQWIVEYGQEGFAAGAGTMSTVTGTSSSITSLTPLTDYTIYIYAKCANGDTSLALVKNFTTLPNCSNPSNIAATSSPDSLKVTWAWTETAGHPIQGFKIHYGMTGFELYSGTTVSATGVNLADTVFDASLLGSGVYHRANASKITLML